MSSYVLNIEQSVRYLLLLMFMCSHSVSSVIVSLVAGGDFCYLFLIHPPIGLFGSSAWSNCSTSILYIYLFDHN